MTSEPTNTPPAPALKFPDHWKIFPAPSPEPAETNDGGIIPTPGSFRILVAEDDAVSARVLASRLLQWGYDPIVTRDGNEAMKAMRSADAPSLVILDWMMPGMDGLEVCRRLREVSKVVYIIFLTARDAKENIAEALGAGADDYLVKPFHKLELQARIHVGLRIIGLLNALSARGADASHPGHHRTTPVELPI